MSDQLIDESAAVVDLLEVKFVGPATATVLADAGVEATEIEEKTVCFEDLVEVGANVGVATKIRREHSLSWNFGGTSGEELETRSGQIRGLQDDERDWVAASSGDWQDRTVSPTEPTDADATAAAETDGSGEVAAAEAAWRERSRPDPVTEVSGIGAAYAERLAEAGINSVRSLAAADPESVADVLDFDVEQVAEWRERASDLS